MIYYVVTASTQDTGHSLLKKSKLTKSIEKQG